MLYFENKLWSAASALLIKQHTFPEESFSFISRDDIHDLNYGDTLIGFSDTVEVPRGVVHLSYKRPDGREGAIALLEDLLPRGHWLINELKTTSFILGALYNAYYEDTSYYIRETPQITVEENKSIIEQFIKRVAEEAHKIVNMGEQQLISGFVLFRHSPFSAYALEFSYKKGWLSESLTGVEINSRENSLFLKLNGGDSIDIAKEIFKEQTQYTNDSGLYIMLPDEITDISIDAVIDFINKKLIKEG